MAITKIQSESLNLADDFAFTGTITGAGGGKVLQVIQATNTTLFSSSSTSMTATGKIVSITPSSTSSKIFLTFSYVIRKTVDDNNIFQNIFRQIGAGSYSALIGGRGLAQHQIANSSQVDTVHVTLNYLDSPNTTSAINYQLYCQNESGGTFVVSPDSVIAVMTAWEIGA